MPPPEASPRKRPRRRRSAAAPARRRQPAAPQPPAAGRTGAAPQPVQKAALRGRADAGTVQVRLGSLRTPEEAREEWQRLKRANGDLLGSLRANAVSVDLGEKGIYYRILAGPLDERRPSGCAAR